MSGDTDVGAASASETFAASSSAGRSRNGPGEADIRAFEALFGRTDEGQSGDGDDPSAGPADRNAATDPTSEATPRSSTPQRERAGSSWEDARRSLSSADPNRSGLLLRSLRDARDRSTDAGDQDGLDGRPPAASAEPVVPLVQAATPAPQVPVVAGDVAEVAALLERYVRQLAVTSGDVRDPGVLLRMSAAALPDTDLILRRTARGWKLQVTSGSASALETLEQHAPALIARFARADLGELEIEQRSRQDGSDTGQGAVVTVAGAPGR